MRHLIPLMLLPAALAAQEPRPATRAVYLDSSGVVRWRDNRQELTLFGSNYVIHTASDYRAAGYVGGDRKQMIDEDVAQMVRMGWDGMRITFWGDWQSADSAGNLIANDHLDLMDYLIAKAKERGIYLLFSPIQLYSANWPDSMQNDPRTPGFGRVFGRQRMGTDAAAIAAQQNYLRQILDHVNPYTGVAIKNEPAIVMIELVNEPWHHSDDIPGSIRYINALVDAVRGTGCGKLIFYNISQDFRIGEAIRRSRAQGITFGWYPTGLNSGRELVGNYLRGVDDFPDMRRPEFARLPRIVYEFDSPDLREATMYPAMTRTMRSVGGQMALMFAYDMQRTGSRNLGWQTHYLSLAYTPRKAMSTVIAAEAMRRLPRGESYGEYPRNNRFGDFRVSPDSNLSELVTADVFIHAGNTTTQPRDPSLLRRLAGVGSSPLVRYEGEGAWFLDKVRDGVWRLEVYPDAVPVRDPFEMQSPDKIVTRMISRVWPMTVTLPGLGETFAVQPVNPATAQPSQASNGRFMVTPGVYVLSAGPVNLRSMPGTIAGLRFDEYHAPPADTLPMVVTSLAPPLLPANRDARLSVRIVDDVAPDSATLYLRRTAGDWYRPYALRAAGGYEYRAAVPAGMLREGPHEFVVTVYRGGRAMTYPEGIALAPTAWNWYGHESWTLDVAARGTPLVLFDPARDASSLTFTRIGDAGRRGLFGVRHSRVTAAPVFRLTLPADSGGLAHDDYTASLVVLERVQARGVDSSAQDVQIRLRGAGPRQTLHLTLMERDGTSWSAPIDVDTAWVERTIPLRDFASARGVLLPQGFPGQWNYWVGPAAGRGGSNDRINAANIERIQFSLRREQGRPRGAGDYGVEIERVTLRSQGREESEAACCRVSFRVTVPDSTNALFITGNRPELSWRPNALQLDGLGRERTGSLTIPAGQTFEYKFTLGSWDREALTAAGTVPANHQLAVARDTTVVHDIPAFKRDAVDYLADWRGSGVLGRLVYWPNVRSAHLTPTRHVVVWLPPDYDSNTTRRYKVLYMHDAQNIFDPRQSFNGVDWGVDEAIMRLVGRGVMEPVIVVGAYSSGERSVEYSPWHGAERYARFLADELMPRVNREFRTLTGPANTAVMGSSMGGLLSFYLVTHRSETFGSCGCISTHFPISEDVAARVLNIPVAGTPDTTPYVVRDIARGLRAPRGARYFFAHGTVGLDSNYAPTHAVVRQWLIRQGKREGTDFVIRPYQGATHNEAAWRAQMEDVLTFLYGRGR